MSKGTLHDSAVLSSTFDIQLTCYGAFLKKLRRQGSFG